MIIKRKEKKRVSKIHIPLLFFPPALECVVCERGEICLIVYIVYLLFSRLHASVQRLYRRRSIAACDLRLCDLRLPAIFSTLRLLVAARRERGKAKVFLYRYSVRARPAIRSNPSALQSLSITVPRNFSSD